MLKKLIKNNYLFFLMLITFIMICFSSSVFSKKIFACNTTNMQNKSFGKVLEIQKKRFNSVDCKTFSLMALNRINLFNLGISIDPDDIKNLNDITKKCSDIINSASYRTFKEEISDQESSNKNLVTIINNLKKVKVIMKNSIHNSIKIHDNFTNWNQYFENCCDILFSSLIECSETYSDTKSESILIFMATQITGMLSDLMIPYILAD